MSNRCPYFLENCRNKIVCDGITEDFNIHQAFANSKDKREYVQDYCNGFYASCFVAQILNERYEKYTTNKCKHNADVDCLDVTECHSCGWNPIVASERLRKWREIHGCDE